MAEVLVEYNEFVTANDGRKYLARACAAEGENGHWQAWLEFTDQESGQTIRTGRETTQPNRADMIYWATGLTPIYLEGALARARHPLVRPAPRPAPQPHFDGPAPNVIEDPGLVEAAPGESILNPLSVYRKGEDLLRKQLSALSPWHLVNIVGAYSLSDLPTESLQAMTARDLVELIVKAVQVRSELPLSP